MSQLSPLARVSVSGEIYILECVGAGFIRIEPLTDPEGGFPTSLRASHRLIQEPRAKPQVHDILATWDKATAKTLDRSPYL